jgi:FtsP/CotA-like multicopper oxidase with cupredoxin domain
MSTLDPHRRNFLKTAGATAAATLLSPPRFFGQSAAAGDNKSVPQSDNPADYTLTIATKPLEIAPKRILSVTTYNGQFPGPLLRFKEGQQVTIDIRNDTDTPEQLHWHGQMVSTEVDGAAEEGTPFVPSHGNRRISFIPKPSGFRFYHTHVRAGANLALGQYCGLVGPVYIEPKQHPGNYDREVFLTLKEFQPSLSHGGDMGSALPRASADRTRTQRIWREQNESFPCKWNA